MNPRDLAPGDLIPPKGLPSDIELCRVESPVDPLFEPAYQLLEAEFGRANEIETREVLIDRMSWQTDQVDEEVFVMGYQWLVLKVAGEIAAVRDHSAIVSQGEVTVHLSHVLVLPQWRRSGLATILRTLPVSFAKSIATRAGVPDAPITLTCEMDLYEPQSPSNQIRRSSYAKAGFLSIPSGHGYIQPDFRAKSLIDSDPEGPRPVKLDLLFRRVCRENEKRISRAELLVHIGRIYHMYGRNIAPENMEASLAWLESFRTVSQEFHPLVPPTAAL